MSFVFNPPVHNSVLNIALGSCKVGKPDHNLRTPNMDFLEDTEKNLVTATFEFPGLTKENIQIECQNTMLTVSAETKRSEYHEEDYTIQERYYGKYFRTLQLPIGVRDENITATVDNGVLTITFPKSTPEQETRRIPIG